MSFMLFRASKCAEVVHMVMIGSDFGIGILINPFVLTGRVLLGFPLAVSWVFKDQDAMSVSVAHLRASMRCRNTRFSPWPHPAQQLLLFMANVTSGYLTQFLHNTK